MEKNRIILIIAIVAIILVLGVVGVFMVTGSNVNPLASGKDQIVVESDTKFNGSIQIFTYKNLTSNSNGSYNYSQFFDQYGYPVGSQIDIPIVNGKATFDIPKNVKFVAFGGAGSGTTDKNYGYNTGKSVTVSFYSNGVLMGQSITDIYADLFDVELYNNIYSTNGEVIPMTDLIGNPS